MLHPPPDDVPQHAAKACTDEDQHELGHCGLNSRLHTAKILRLSEDLPMVIEIVDSREKIDELMPDIDDMVREGLETLENVRVIRYRGKEGKQ